MQLRFAPLCVAALTACLDPTEFVVTITTDAPCPLMGINIVLTRPDDTTTVAPSAVTQQCTGGRVGSIVVLPNPQRGDTVLRVVAGIGESPDACEKDGYTGGCIVERRLMRFVNHSKLQLDVSLRLDCLNIPCDVKSTCVNGRCMPIDASSDGGPGTLPTIAGCDMQGLQQNAPMPMSGYCPANAHRTPFVGPHALPRVL